MIQRVISQLQDFFGISRKEARGTFVLMVLLIFLIWTPFVFRRWVLPHFPLATQDQSADSQKLDRIVNELNRSDPDKTVEEKHHPPNSNKSPVRPVKPVQFDPNIASVDVLTEMGIPSFLAKRIDNYRSKGGKFRKKVDLLNIYDFPAELYKTLEPYIVLPDREPKTIADAVAIKPTPYLKEPNRFTKPAIAPFDINTADTIQLVQLKGIGTKLSLRIIKFRDALGGFHEAGQFGEIYGLDSTALSELNKYAKVQSPVKKLNINSATSTELTAHPYLRNKKWVAVIINYRTQHGPYTSAEDLKKIKALDTLTIEKLKPYLEY